MPLTLTVVPLTLVPLTLTLVPLSLTPTLIPTLTLTGGAGCAAGHRPRVG